jgi:hypothetical protein
MTKHGGLGSMWAGLILGIIFVAIYFWWAH